VQHPARHRVPGRQPGEPVYRERTQAGDEHQVPEPAPAQHPRVGYEAHLRENRPGRGHLRPGVRQRRPVRHVGGEHATAVQHPARGAEEFDRGQMGRGAARGEHVRDHHVVAAGPQPLQHVAGVPDPDPHPAHRQPEPDQAHQRGVDLDGQLR
jgi:hypothetical protein